MSSNSFASKVRNVSVPRSGHVSQGERRAGVEFGGTAESANFSRYFNGINFLPHQMSFDGDSHNEP
jgi:hypothetical protein